MTQSATTLLNRVQVKPTFLFIGADRCGSKSLHNIFRQHPDGFVPAIADPYFFDRHYDRGWDWYFSLFADAPPSSRAIGEFSHDYIHSPEAARRIADDLPDVQLLATFRHPVDRTYSSFASAVNAGVMREPFERALEEYPWLITNSLYADKLDLYFSLFPRDRFKILWFEDLEADPKEFAAQAFKFLGLPVVDEIDYGTRLSVLSKSRWPWAGAATKLGANTLRRLGWVNLLGRLKSSPKFRALFYRPYESAERKAVAPETRRKLQQVFAPQIDRLEELLNRDLSHWRE